MYRPRSDTTTRPPARNGVISGTAQPARRPATNGRARSTASILVVDDEVALCEGLRDRLYRAGYGSEMATSAEAATALLGKKKFDLVLCDVMMPGRSGLELVREILQEHTAMAAIMMSGLDDPDVAESAVALGAYGYIVKPFTSNELTMQIRNALKRLELERENAKRRRALEAMLVQRTEALTAEQRLRGLAARQAREKAALLTTLQERQDLFERLLAIQRSVSHATSLEAVLDTIVSGAQQLLGDEVVTLSLPGNGSPHPTIVAAHGIPPAMLSVPVNGDDACARPPAADVVVVVTPDGSGPLKSRTFAMMGVHKAIVAPVRERGTAIGALAVGSIVTGRVFTDAEREALGILAEHAGVVVGETKSHMRAHEAFHDDVTELPNRASFLEALERADGERVGVILLDLDGFRPISERLGAPAAERLLVAAAERVVACAPDALVARLGPDEFGVLLEDVDSQAVETQAESVITAFGTAFQSGTASTELSVSAGAACASGDANDLVRDASVALFRAKLRGGGRWEIFGAAMRQALVSQFDLESDLEGAVGRGEIHVVYQPVIELETGRVDGFEALARWEHPSRGVVPPLEFIPLAESLGILGDIGRHVVNVACERAAAWQKLVQPGEAPWVSVNFSALELERDAFTADVAGALERSGLPPELLVIEITEGVLIGDTDVARDRLEGVRAVGTRIAIDDFGTGHASLEYIRRLPFDVLKIAREFCDGADRSPEEADLVRTVVNLSKRFGLDVIAEGIERVEQRDALIEMGCALGQGYYFARPLEADGAESFLLTQQPEPAAALTKAAA